VAISRDTISILVMEDLSMALGNRNTERQHSLWLATKDIAGGPSFYWGQWAC